MGRRGPLPKPDALGRRVRDNIVALKTIQGGLTIQRPDCPETYGDETKEAWRHYWSSELVEAIIDIDVVGVGAYFRLLDQWYVLQRAAEVEGPFATGSTGQLTIHPAVKEARELLKDLTKLGQELGIMPMARQRLGITSAKRAMTAAELNDMVHEREPRRPSRKAAPAKRKAAPPKGEVYDVDWEDAD